MADSQPITSNMATVRRVAPFVYIVIGIVSELLFSDRVASVVWTVGALLLAAMYSLGLGRVRRFSDSDRAAARAERRDR